jgi:hypothetical protein
MSNAKELTRARPTNRFAAALGKLDRRVVFAGLGLAAAGAAMFYGWDRLAALGLTAFIVSLLPCALMCGLGICASRLTGKARGGCGGGSSAEGKPPASTPRDQP